MRARIAPPSVATLLLIALLSPAIPAPPAKVAASAATSGERAVPVARRLSREPQDAMRAADLAIGLDATLMSAPLVRAGDAASRLEAIAPTPTPAPTRRPVPVVVAPQSAVTDPSAERRMLELINASRAAGGLVPLATDDRASAAARAHSAAESRYGYVYHDGPDGTAASRNVPACGTGWYGENTGKIWNDNVAALHVEFMSEPWAPINHRTNIMDPAFRRIGIGAVEGRDALYMTMVFCR